METRYTHVPSLEEKNGFLRLHKAILSFRVSLSSIQSFICKDIGLALQALFHTVIIMQRKGSVLAVVRVSVVMVSWRRTMVVED